MGLTSSLDTALSGLSTSQQQIEVVGNNIANVNTIGYKSTSLDFKTQFLQNFSFGSAPTSTDGGTNPLQIGLGVQSGAITTDFSDGAVQATGQASNMAIQGNGFFVLNEGPTQVFTRDGTFQLNNQNQLVSTTGQIVQGYGVDSNSNIVPGVLTNVVIPVNSSIAQATSTASFTGNLSSNGTLPTSVSQVTMNQPMYLSNGSGGVDPLNAPTDTGPSPTLLTNITDASGTPQFQVGDVLSFTGKLDGKTAATQTLTVGATTTIADLEAFTSGTLGIDTAAGANGGIATAPGASLAANPDPSVPPGSALFTIAGNPGTANNISLDANSLTITRGATTLSPYGFTSTSNATGESVTAQWTAYDSLGDAVPVNVTAVLSSQSSTGSTWQLYTTSPGNVAAGTGDPNSFVGSGTLSFDNHGNLLNTTGTTVTINRPNTGAIPNLVFTMDFSGATSQNATSKPITPGASTSTLQESTQDGAPPGQLNTYSIGNNGIITGSYSNGLHRTVGQIALATFQNDEGLVDDGNNTYSVGPNSGNAVITAPQQLSAGAIVDSAVEGSNVDLSSEFVKLISASTAFSASSRVITSSEQLLQALLQAAQG